MSEAIYAIKVDGEVVYVGQSEDVQTRTETHLSQIRRGLGIAAKYPEVFAGKSVEIEILERMKPGNEPVRIKGDEASQLRHLRWSVLRRSRRLEREWFYIKALRPKCNVHGMVGRPDLISA